LAQYGFPTNRQKRIPCPFHNGKNNNFSYTDEVYYCFVCGAKGNVITFIKDWFQINHRQALIRLNADFGLGLSGRRPTRREITQRELERAQIQAELDQFRAEYEEKTGEYCDLWHAIKRSAQAPPQLGDDRYAIALAGSLARLEQLDAWFEANPWR
jgi:hypothetical protein